MLHCAVILCNLFLLLLCIFGLWLYNVKYEMSFFRFQISRVLCLAIAVLIKVM